MEYIYLNILGCVRAGTSGWQLETWFLPLCGCFIKLEIFGLFRCQSHSRIEGTRFPKVLSRFLTFFDLEDFALLGIVFVITVHCSLLVQWVLSYSTEHWSRLLLRKAGSCPHIQNHLSSFLLSPSFPTLFLPSFSFSCPGFNAGSHTTFRCDVSLISFNL